MRQPLSAGLWIIFIAGFAATLAIEWKNEGWNWFYIVYFVNIALGGVNVYLSGKLQGLSEG